MKTTRMANDSTDWNNIFQMHVKGSNWPEVGCKIPEVLFNLKNKMAIYGAINCETVNLGSDQMPTLKLDTWMSIKIGQELETDGVYRTKVWIDKQLLYTIENKQPQVFEKVQVFASRSLSSGYSGIVRKLSVEKKEGGEAAFMKIAAMHSETIHQEMLQRDCIESSDDGQIENSTVNSSNLPDIDIFLNPQKASEVKHIVDAMMNTSREYFNRVNMELLFPELFRALWHYTLPCFPQSGVEHAILRSCTIGQENVPCEQIFRRLPTDSGLPPGFISFHVFPHRNVLCPEL